MLADFKERERVLSAAHTFSVAIMLPMVIVISGVSKISEVTPPTEEVLEPLAGERRLLISFASSVVFMVVTLCLSLSSPAGHFLYFYYKNGTAMGVLP